MTARVVTRVDPAFVFIIGAVHVEVSAHIRPPGEVPYYTVALITPKVPHRQRNPYQIGNVYRANKARTRNEQRWYSWLAPTHADGAALYGPYPGMREAVTALVEAA